MAQASVRSEDIICPGGMPAFLARPDRPGTFPVVVLMHERYGLVKHAKDLALRAAGDGVLALAPNFFFKHPDQQTLNAGNSRYDLSDPESVQLIKAALTALHAAFAKGIDANELASGLSEHIRHLLVLAVDPGADDLIPASPEDLARLAGIVRGVPSKLNLIPFNPVPGLLAYHAPTPRAARACSSRCSAAAIAGDCGDQLRANRRDASAASKSKSAASRPARAALAAAVS